MVMDMEYRIKQVLDVVVEEGLSKAMLYYSSLIAPAPKQRLRTNAYNTYTPKGQGTVWNNNYKKELTAWKKDKLFPFFLQHGYTKEQITEAYNKSVFKK